MAMILGIDAAWTEANPSGVALLDTSRGQRCVSVAPSYQAFVAQHLDSGFSWTTRAKGGRPPVPELLQAVVEAVGSLPDVIAVDMPIASVPITARRAADNRVSQEYGSRWCSAHTPSAQRPGPIGAALSAGFLDAGYPLAAAGTPCGTTPALIEVYPHPALLSLLGREKRVPYKVSKARQYWPDLTPVLRRAAVVRELRAIWLALEGALGELPLPADELAAGGSKSELKRLEDALDAVVSAWVGMLYLSGDATPFGDTVAAVWCPTTSVRSAAGVLTER